MEIKQVLTSGILIGGFLLPSSVAYSQNTQNEKSKVYVVADAHLDTQWNWDIQKTIKEYVWNTINQNLFLLKKYPDYVFNFEGGVKYSWMKEYYPREYEELKKYMASHYNPNMTVIVKTKQNEEELQKIVKYIKDYHAIDDKTTYYICEDHHCHAPTTKL